MFVYMVGVCDILLSISFASRASEWRSFGSSHAAATKPEHSSVPAATFIRLPLGPLAASDGRGFNGEHALADRGFGDFLLASLKASCTLH